MSTPLLTDIREAGSALGVKLSALHNLREKKPFALKRLCSARFGKFGLNSIYLSVQQSPSSETKSGRRPPILL